MERLLFTEHAQYNLTNHLHHKVKCIIIGCNVDEGVLISLLIIQEEVVVKANKGQKNEEESAEEPSSEDEVEKKPSKITSKVITAYY